MHHNPVQFEPFEECFKTFYPDIIRYVERLVCDPKTAEDITQDVFMKLYESKYIKQNQLSIRAWLFTSAKNAAIDYLRSLKLRDQHGMLLMEAMLYSNQIDESVDEEMSKKINEALKTLPPQCALIIRLKIIDNKKYQEIAEELNISVNTIRTQIKRGYRKLRHQLENDAALWLFISFRISE